jgi:hypothetical protein
VDAEGKPYAFSGRGGLYFLPGAWPLTFATLFIVDLPFFVRRRPRLGAAAREQVHSHVTDVGVTPSRHIQSLPLLGVS